MVWKSILFGALLESDINPYGLSLVQRKFGVFVEQAVTLVAAVQVLALVYATDALVEVAAILEERLALAAAKIARVAAVLAVAKQNY
eukprot:IDg7771t1